MATRDEEDVRSRNTRRTQQSRNRDYRTVRRTSQPSNTSANAGALALTLGAAAEAAPTFGQIARGVLSGVGAGLGSMSGMTALPALTIGSIPLMIGYEMSGKGRPIKPVPNYNIENGRYIAQPDATTVTLRPSPAGDYLYSSSKKKKNKGNNRSTPAEPDPLPVDVNAGDQTEELPASSTATGETQATQTATQTEQTAAPASPEPENNDSNKKPKGRFRRALDALRNKDIQQTSNNTNVTQQPKRNFFQRWGDAYKNGNWYGNTGRFIRDWQIVTTGLDLADNAINYGGEVAGRKPTYDLYLTENISPIGLAVRYRTQPGDSLPPAQTNNSSIQITNPSVNQQDSIDNDSLTPNQALNLGIINMSK